MRIVHCSLPKSPRKKFTFFQTLVNNFLVKVKFNEPEKKVTQSDLEKLVKDFYENDLISSQLPG